MKSRSPISIIASALMVALYLVATVGIDVHVDHHDGEVFVVSLLGRTDCESLHPDDVCHCVEHLHHHCHEDDEDCENEISVVSLTGDGFDFTVDFTPVEVTLHDILTPYIAFASCECTSVYDIHDTSPRGYLNSLCVLRV